LFGVDPPGGRGDAWPGVAGGVGSGRCDSAWAGAASSGTRLGKAAIPAAKSMTIASTDWLGRRCVGFRQLPPRLHDPAQAERMARRIRIDLEVVG
jgi:hypothetical protein